MPEVAPVLIVCAEEARVEAELRGGSLACPSCRGLLGPWGHARERVLRCSAGDRMLRPRRARCRLCAGTHVLLPDLVLLRRRDEAAVIGAAIEANAAGAGHRTIAERLGVPKDTVRGWLRRFVERAEQARAHFTRWAFVLDQELGSILPAGGVLADALEAIAVAVRAWVLRFGPTAAWQLVSVLSGGRLLCNTSCPFPPVR
jgi:transposase-like protein